MSVKKPAAKSKVKASNPTATEVSAKRKPVVEEKEPARTEPTRAMDARANKDRRDKDRREKDMPVAVERRATERRVKVSRRRQIDPTTCERDYSPEEVEFMGALDDYKRRSGRMFPTCSEILEVFKALGYERHVELSMAAPSFAVAVPATASEQAV